jgi:hypothetical protein
VLNKQTKQTKECLNQVGSISFDNPCFTYSGELKWYQMRSYLVGLEPQFMQNSPEQV